VPVLAHRVIAASQLYGAGSRLAEEIIRDIVDSVPVPE